MNAYVISCNTRLYDVVGHFEQNEIIVWKQVRDCSIGDIIYVYIGKPYSKIMYKCEVIKVNLKEAEVDNTCYQTVFSGKKIIKLMELKLLKKLPESGLDYCQLIKNGLKTVQCATKVEDKLQQYINSLEKKES